MKKLFKTLDESLGEINKIKKTDLKSGETSIEEAVDFCSSALEVILRSKNLYLDKQQTKQYAQALKKIGCVEYKDAHEIYKTSSKNYFDELADEPLNIELPLTAFTQILPGRENCLAIVDRLEDGAKRWLETQEACKQSQPGEE